ncbi:fatty acid desaturase [Jannaschia sp. Os4]|uniref:fatty acid desaturase family protein n=1 Tax=Jannaschia sp. Os4 TaxID=2807617 RepID=UPI00193AB7AB|nr:fatty acid desaturase [Jannaschia sp. Os4]MBM2575985.1 fatty acid desaturase [Jannaschia sp. Os4]
MGHAPATETPRSYKDWARELRPYQNARLGRSLLEIAITLLPYAALWLAAAALVARGQWWGLLLTIPAAGFLLRVFILQHDCGHGALFASKRANDWTGRLLGVLTFAPYDYWRRSHAVHHGGAGNLDRRGLGDITTLTVAEYRAQSRLGRLRYRLYRHPAVMFGIGPAWMFLCQFRLPVGLMRDGPGPWVSTLATTLAVVPPALLLASVFGWGPVLAVQLPTTLIAATAGIWLFYVQHQFEETHWSEEEEWRFGHAALHGSSNYVLPRPLPWITGYVGVHHVHHLAARIPFYRLPEVLRDHPDLARMGRITVRESLATVRLTLWDEAARRLISFREAHAAA